MEHSQFHDRAVVALLKPDELNHGVIESLQFHDRAVVALLKLPGR